MSPDHTKNLAVLTYFAGQSCPLKSGCE